MVTLRKKSKKRCRVVACTAGVIFLVSLTLFIVGLVLILNNKCDDLEGTGRNIDLCKHSNEAIKSGLIDLLDNVRHKFNEVCPCAFLTVSNKNPVPPREYLNPITIKDTTDQARSLLKQLKSLTIDESKLTPRELRGLAEVRHFLLHNFGYPEDDYYSGSWLLGPNMMCASDYMCKWFKYHIIYTAFVLPKTTQDILQIRKALEYYNKTVHQYMENIRYGVKSGMVQSIEACLAGVYAIKTQYLKVAEFNDIGILQESFVQPMLKPRYYASLRKETKEEWLKTHGKTVNESIKDFLIEYIGKPLEKLLKFLEYDHIQYCVPSTVASGLANLPLSHIYFNGTKTDKATSPFLPTGEKLSGKNAYEKLLTFHTTTNISADEVNALGWKHVNLLYPQILELAKNVTGHSNESRAIKDFQDLLTDRSQYYNKQPFPQNESFAKARENCVGVENAKKYCPKRWEALQIWIDEEAKILSKLDPKTYNLFHYTGSKRTTPNCPIQLLPSFMSVAALSYRGYSSCRKPAQIGLPFFNDDYGPRYQGLSINGHEARPGHHTQMQGYLENFERSCPQDDLTWLDKRTRYSAFTEGWGLYAEYPLLPEFTDVYENKPLSRYGMLKGQMWRALRLVVDSGLHYKEMTRDEAMALFKKYMWDTSDVMEKEITRYESVPGQATSYKFGQLTFIDLRDYAQKQLGEKFNIRDFHYELLRHGSVPLHYIKYQVNKYVACKTNATDCEYLRTTVSAMLSDSNDASQSDSELDLYEMVNSEIYY